MKITFLDRGALSTDAALFVRGANAGTVDAPAPAEHEWRDMQLIGVAIEHPTAGLLLYDTGLPPVEGDRLGERFSIVDRRPEHDLDGALAAAGLRLADVAGVIVSHLHYDHGGGLVHFRGTEVPIYVHAEELRHALFAVATDEDPGNYDPRFVDVSANSRPLHGDVIDLFAGIELHRLPGHSPGLLALRLTRDDGPSLLLASDHYPYPDNRGGSAQGWATRDDTAWHASSRRIEVVIRRHGLEVLYGHDAGTFRRLSGLTRDADRSGIRGPVRRSGLA